MSDSLQLNYTAAEQAPLHQFAEQAYLDYAMYVILDRALPHISDGLKPVQRRIIYAMSELGLKASAKYKKSARTVGDVIGKFHPHGDAACYEAMVLMAQQFSYRYPLIDGQGNWGSVDDPKSFAAMRYTESRLTPYTTVLLRELEQGTVDWNPNFDSTLKEPTQLPARLPNILLNGATGIAVGMATDIPPHNIQEVVDACIFLLDTPNTTMEALCKYIKGPDFPSYAEIITPTTEIQQIYKTGSGSIKARATWSVENGNIVIAALPHQSSGGKIVEQIATQIKMKKLPMLESLRDESDYKNPTRLVLIPRSKNVDKEELMSHLFATTDLERAYRVNLNMIGTDGRPQVKDLESILREWLQYRLQTVKKRLRHRLDMIGERLHILAGLLIAHMNIEQVISIIREAEDPGPTLMQQLNLSAKQTEAILELRLRRLAKLEQTRLEQEQDELAKEQTSLQQTLDSQRRLKALIKKELQEDAAQFGDMRRSVLRQREDAKTIASDRLISAEAVTVILSEKGWIRAAKGHEIDVATLNYRRDDALKQAATGRNNQQAILLDSGGRCYALAIHTLPSARGLGEPVSARLNPPDGVHFAGLMVGDVDAADTLYLLSSDAGYGFIVRLSDLYTKSKNGKAILSVPPGARAMPPVKIDTNSDDQIAAVNASGHLLLLPLAELPTLSKGKGLKIIHIAREGLQQRTEYMCAITVLKQQSALLLTAGKRQLTLRPKEQQHYINKRGRRGMLLPRGFRNISTIAAIADERNN